MTEISDDYTEMRARLSEQRRKWAAKGEPYPTEELARQQAEALQEEAEQQYWEELPLIDSLRTTAFQLRRVLSLESTIYCRNRPVNEDRLLALVDRQEQNMLNYEAWMATHDRMKEEADWCTAVYQRLFRNPLFPSFPVTRRRSIRPGMALFTIEERRQQAAEREAEEPLLPGEGTFRRF